MRASTLLNRLLCLPKTTVRAVKDRGGQVRVEVRPHRWAMRCPCCAFTATRRYDTRVVDSTWRHLDLGGRICVLALRRRRLVCPEHGVHTEGVDFARPWSGFTRDFEDLVGWLATTMDKTTALTRLVRIDWDTTGRIIQRVMGTNLDPTGWGSVHGRRR